MSLPRETGGFIASKLYAVIKTV